MTDFSQEDKPAAQFHEELLLAEEEDEIFIEALQMQYGLPVAEEYRRIKVLSEYAEMAPYALLQVVKSAVFDPAVEAKVRLDLMLFDGSVDWGD